eukprot:TRINITY_DN8331_c0_g1_i1.p1 TRINITY_DN8331_c0_g1~~TRINITY_DN8331_c0_g1_i1.p1  ORF type:complete len:629 (+),score=175.69 TRINITY_DN8331_c0_g1_i1:278-1888(+)
MDEILRFDEKYDQSRPEARERTMLKFKRIRDIMKESEVKRTVEVSSKRNKNQKLQKATQDAFYEIMSLYDPSWATRIGVHFGLFVPGLVGQGNEQQHERWLEDAQRMKIIGCFAMTELGHGSYVRGLETTATYDKATQEFILNSPTDTSTKWWIGLAGQTATHCVAFARLIIDGKDYGVHSFMVQIRRPEDGTPMPNIKVGDCGAKMGRNGLDNGWIQFHHVRIPRDHMLMKWASVSPEGIYTNPPSAQLAYGALIGGRVIMVKAASDVCKKSLTVAIRYSAVRRQFVQKEGYGEEQILNYQTHQYRLMPILATCFAYHFVGQQMSNQFEAMQEDMNQLDLSTLPEVHATSAGLKAFATWWCNESIEQCRQCCGGNGYSAYAGFASELADYAVMCTWEGDNTVMAQQSARYLIKSWKKSRRGKKVPGSLGYLEEANQIQSLQCQAASSNDFLNQEIQLQSLQRAVIFLLNKTANRMENEKQTGNHKSDIWNACMVDLVECARVHCQYYTFSCFVETLKQQRVAENPPIHGVLKKIV